MNSGLLPNKNVYLEKYVVDVDIYSSSTLGYAGNREVATRPDGSKWPEEYFAPDGVEAEGKFWTYNFVAPSTKTYSSSAPMTPQALETYLASLKVPDAGA